MASVAARAEQDSNQSSALAYTAVRSFLLAEAESARDTTFSEFMGKLRSYRSLLAFHSGGKSNEAVEPEANPHALLLDAILAHETALRETDRSSARSLARKAIQNYTTLLDGRSNSKSLVSEALQQRAKVQFFESVLTKSSDTGSLLSAIEDSRAAIQAADNAQLRESAQVGLAEVVTAIVGRAHPQFSRLQNELLLDEAQRAIEGAIQGRQRGGLETVSIAIAKLRLLSVKLLVVDQPGVRAKTAQEARDWIQRLSFAGYQGPEQLAVENPSASMKANWHFSVGAIYAQQGEVAKGREHFELGRHVAEELEPSNRMRQVLTLALAEVQLRQLGQVRDMSRLKSGVNQVRDMLVGLSDPTVALRAERDRLLAAIDQWQASN